MDKIISFFLYVLVSFSLNAAPPLKVGVIEGHPFAFQDGEEYSGIAVDLWNELALGLGQAYEIKTPIYKDWKTPFEDLANGKVDVLIGPISVTSDRFMQGDFTLPYFIDKVIAITPSDYLHNTLILIKLFFYSVGTLLSFFFGLFFFYIILLWYYEKQHDQRVPRGFREGVAYLFWVHVHMGRHDEVPKSSPGRFLMLFQRSFFYIILIVLNATMISFVTISVQKYASPIQSIGDLERERVGATKSSRSLKTAQELGIHAIAFDSIKDGVDALLAGQIQSFLTDLSLADAYLRDNSIHDLSVSNFTLKYDAYVFVTRIGSPLLREINKEMLSLRAKGTPDKICKGYLIKGIRNCDL